FLGVHNAQSKPLYPPNTTIGQVNTVDHQQGLVPGRPVIPNITPPSEGQGPTDNGSTFAKLPPPAPLTGPGGIINSPAGVLTDFGFVSPQLPMGPVPIASMAYRFIANNFGSGYVEGAVTPYAVILDAERTLAESFEPEVVPTLIPDITVTVPAEATPEPVPIEAPAVTVAPIETEAPVVEVVPAFASEITEPIVQTETTVPAEAVPIPVSEPVAPQLPVEVPEPMPLEPEPVLAATAISGGGLGGAGFVPYLVLDADGLTVSKIIPPLGYGSGFISYKEMLIANGAGWQLYHPGRTGSVLPFLRVADRRNAGNEENSKVVVSTVVAANSTVFVEMQNSGLARALSAENKEENAVKAVEVSKGSVAVSSAVRSTVVKGNATLVVNAGVISEVVSSTAAEVSRIRSRTVIGTLIEVLAALFLIALWNSSRRKVNSESSPIGGAVRGAGSVSSTGTKDSETEQGISARSVRGSGSVGSRKLALGGDVNAQSGRLRLTGKLAYSRGSRTLEGSRT
ncbi:MAG: hypothetical protein ACREGC_01805, partial [Minisyncoccia bacterium]